ncbi:MAG: hypothetical protein QXP70_01895 [Methanomassiliicoccales archaeon]
MTGLLLVLIFSAVMGFSVYLTLPMILHSGTGKKLLRLLNAAAIGILIFLIGDVFSNVSTVLYKGGLYGYGTVPEFDLAFAIALSCGFLALYATESRSGGGISQSRLAMIIALGIAFQNLTEGLVFGSLGSIIGLTGAATVVLVGFILQNMTEGFPIAAPFLGKLENREWQMVALLFVGGVPDIIGGAIGYYFNSPLVEVIFDGLAIGTILYVIIPMLRSILSARAEELKKFTYLGLFAGFLIGFLVNLI